MQTIKLKHSSWKFDELRPLAPPGGFGQVFAGTADDGTQVAIKRLHLKSQEAGFRELNIAEELVAGNYEHIIPFFDSGIDADSGMYFIVMAKAEHSLNDQLVKGPLASMTAASILHDIALGLREVSRIVHRDLKPTNVLFHEGKWKIADFGIARFVEDSTSLNTLQGFLSHQYAAPEQWRLERSTNATDIYALGCIGYALVTGQPPFVSGDFRDQHLNKEPAPLSGDPRLRQLLSLCLRKNPPVRPAIASVLSQLELILSNPGSPPSPLSSAAASVAQEIAKTEAEEVRKRAERANRQQLIRDGMLIFEDLMQRLFDEIRKQAPVAKGSWSEKRIELGKGTLSVGVPYPELPRDAFEFSKKDVAIGALIMVTQSPTHYEGRSANLWFADFQGSGQFRWWEVSYYRWGSTLFPIEPFGMRALQELRDADFAAGPISHSVAHAATPTPVDAEYADSFLQRWSAHFAKASLNQLEYPSRLPE